MSTSRRERIAKSQKTTSAALNILKDELSLKIVRELETKTNDFESKLNKRDLLKVQRMEATENLHKADDLLSEAMESANNIVLAFVKESDAKYKEFVKKGTFKMTMCLPQRELLIECNTMLTGLKNNINIGIPQKTIDSLSAAITGFGTALSNSQKISQDEVSAINDLKLIEDEFNLLYKRTVAYLKTIISKNDWDNFF